MTASRFSGWNSLLLGALLAALPARADELAGPRYRIQGFAAQGLIGSTNNNFFGDSKDGVSTEFTEAGIHGTWQPLDALRLSGQIIRALGCKLALDDFGVGFSTFQYLKHLPVDFVKIDGSFIRTLDHSEDDRLFVKALVEAIHGYGKLAVAEYVETAAILQWVSELGVDYAQGYHFGRPQPADVALAPGPG